MSSLAAKIQALLFIYGESLSFNKIAKILGLEISQVKEALETLSVSLEQSSLALTLLMKEDRVQLVTRPEYGALLEKILKTETREDLSPAALETLSIISYASPISRSHIDYIRGVNSSFILRTLLIRGLVERKHHPKNRNIFLYGPSEDLLKQLGIIKLKDLPDYDKFRTLAQSLNQENKTQSQT